MTDSALGMRQLTLLSYNIHGGVGCDDRLDVDRIASDHLPLRATIALT